MRYLIFAAVILFFLAAFNLWAGDKPNQPVIPLLECIKINKNGSIKAYFGYNNQNRETVTIPLGEDNYFSPEPKNRGQLTVFKPGRSNNYPVPILNDIMPKPDFSIIFSKEEIPLWVLRGPDGIARTASASAKSVKCEWHERGF